MGASAVMMDGTPANPGVKEFQVDSVADVSSLPTTKKKGTTGFVDIDALASAGSECVCLEGPRVYRLSEEKGWVEL